MSRDVIKRIDGDVERTGYYDEKGYFKLHCVNGPAFIIHNKEKGYGICVYYLNNERHRIDGPAVEFSSGYKGYWLYGKYYGDKSNYSIEEWVSFAIKQALLK
jgi:hypothetical protein